MAPITKEEVIQKAVHMARTHGDIDMVKFAQSIGIDVYAKEEDERYNAEISVDRTSETFFIIINANHPLVRQRFSIAHEIGHYVLHYERVKKEGFMNREETENINKKMEEEADTLAAEILMPEELVEEFCKKNELNRIQKITEEVINSIADYFKVSRIVAILRMRHLNFYVPYISYS